MRRNLKKPVALLTAALTAASLLAGCGGSSEEGAGADAVSYTHLDVYKRQI